MLPVVHDIARQADLLRRWRFGVIEVRDGELAGVTLRPWPKRISLFEIVFWGNRLHRNRPGDRCWLYYNQPWGYGSFLTLKYCVSYKHTSFRSVFLGLRILDQIAYIKRSDAILCEASNLRLTDRMMSRSGWQRHVNDSHQRHFIRRFYGDYPEHAVAVGDAAWSRSLQRLAAAQQQLETATALCETESPLPRPERVGERG